MIDKPYTNVLSEEVVNRITELCQVTLINYGDCLTVLDFMGACSLHGITPEHIYRAVQDRYHLQTQSVNMLLKSWHN